MAWRRKRDGQYSKTGKTSAERLTAKIKKSLPCPIAGCYNAENITMTEEGFKTACRKHQERKPLWSEVKPPDLIDCKHCEIGKKILAGKEFEPPGGIKLLKLDTLKRRRRK